jgi:hypothetical protein
MTIFSIGHSTHEPDAFVPLVRGIDVIVDVRSHPTSRWEWWRLERMREWLPEHGLAVHWMPSLGGWTKRHYEEWAEPMAAVGVDLAAYSKGAFPKQRIGVDRPKPPAGGRCADLDPPQWTNQGLYDYAWYTMTPEFQDGLRELIDLFDGPDKPNAAIMCCEALWWKCHRSMVADALVARGLDCLHLPPKLPKRETTPRWKRHSEAIGNRLERYPEAVQVAWRGRIEAQAA